MELEKLECERKKKEIKAETEIKTKKHKNSTINNEANQNESNFMSDSKIHKSRIDFEKELINKEKVTL